MVKYEDLSRELIRRFPELDFKFRQEIKINDDSDPGPHVVYGDVLAPHLVQLLEEPSNRNQLSKIFSFLEELAVNPDIHVQEVVAQSVLEDVAQRATLLQAARPFMGPRSRQMVREIGELWGIRHAEEFE